MRLLLIMAHNSPWSLDIAGSLQAAGHEAHVLDFAAPVASEIPTDSRDIGAGLASLSSVTLMPRTGGGAAKLLALTRGIRARAHALRPDLTLCLYGGQFACAAWLSGVRPYAVWVVGSDVLLAGKARRLINRFSLSCAAHVFANGAHLAEAARLQAPAATVENLLNGVDSEQFAPAPRSGPARLFNHRWFAPVYDNQTIIRALALLPPDLPPFEMTFASGGPELEAARALAAQVLPVRLRESVRFLEGSLRRQELLEELARADIYVSMSLSDGTATSVLEALMSGVFPVLSDIPANRGVVDVPRDNGALVPVGDPAVLSRELARRITAVQDCRDAALRIRTHVMQFAASHITRTNLALRLDAIVDNPAISRRTS
jgi:glycosyltransferase involved in cell wall biosynthesis